MSSSTRGHKIKRDIAKDTVLSRIAVSGLLPERFDSLFYEILSGLEFGELEAHRQMAAILFATTSCNLINKIDCRDVHSSEDFQEKLNQFQNIDQLYAQWYRLFDKLNSGSNAKEKTKEEAEETKQSPGELLQDLLANHAK